MNQQTVLGLIMLILTASTVTVLGITIGMTADMLSNVTTIEYKLVKKRGELRKAADKQIKNPNKDYRVDEIKAELMDLIFEQIDQKIKRDLLIKGYSEMPIVLASHERKIIFERLEKEYEDYKIVTEGNTIVIKGNN